MSLPENLIDVRQYCSDLRREVLSSDFANAHATAFTLQALLGKTHRVKSGRLAATAALKKLHAAAMNERRIALRVLPVDQAKVRNFGQRIAVHAFDVSKLPPPVESLGFVPGGGAVRMSMAFLDYKKRFLEGIRDFDDSGLAEHVGDSVRQRLVKASFSKLVMEASLEPVNSSALRGNYEASLVERQAYLTAVASRCSACLARGETPVVLAGRSAVSTLLSEYRWGDEYWKCPLPDGVVVSSGHDGNAPHAISFINGIAVYEFDTPNDDCYVVPVTMLQRLSIAGPSVSGALSISWSEHGDERLKFTLNWEAGFLQAAS